MIRLSWFAFSLAVAVCLAASAQAGTTLLVDFQDNGGAGAGASVDATAADFAGFDANVDLATGVNTFATDFGPDFQPQFPATVTGTGISATLDLSGTAGNTGGFGDAPGDTPIAGDPILGDYFFIQGAGGVINGVISGIEEIGIGDQITLTIFSSGDNEVQGGSVTASQAGGDSFGPALTDGLGNDGPAFAQFTFINNGGDITFDIADGDVDDSFGAAFVALNGVSLTSSAVVPEPATGVLATFSLLTSGLLVRRKK